MTFGVALAVVFALGFGVGFVVAAIAPEAPKSSTTARDSESSGRFMCRPNGRVRKVQRSRFGQ